MNNVVALEQRMRTVNADRTIDRQESKDVCPLRDKWIAQMEAALKYLADFTALDAKTVEINQLDRIIGGRAENVLESLYGLRCE